MSYAPIPMVPGPVALHEDVIAVLGRDYGSGHISPMPSPKTPVPTLTT